jgi:hypothetical protein
MLIDVEHINNDEKVESSSSINNSNSVEQNRRPIDIGDMSNDEKVKVPSSSTSIQSNGRLPSPLPRLRSNSSNRYQTDNNSTITDITLNRYQQSRLTPTTYKSHSSLYHTAINNGESASNFDIPIKTAVVTDTRTSFAKKSTVNSNVQQQPTPSKSFRKTVPLPSSINKINEDRNAYVNNDDLSVRRNFTDGNNSTKIDHESVRNNGIEINQSLSTPRMNHSTIHMGNDNQDLNNSYPSRNQDLNNSYQSRNNMDNNLNENFGYSNIKSNDYTKSIDNSYPDRTSRSYKSLSTCTTPDSRISPKANPDIRVHEFPGSTNNSYDYELKPHSFVQPDSLLLIEL